MDLSVIKTEEDVGIQNFTNSEQTSCNSENLKETEHKEHIGFTNHLKTEMNNKVGCNYSSLFQGVTNKLEVENSIFNYASFKYAMDLRIHNRNNEEKKKTIFDDAEYFAKNHLYKLLPITFEMVDETIIHTEHNYCHYYVSSESEADEYCSRTMDFSQIREKNYKRRRTKVEESADDEENDDNGQNDQNIASLSSTFNSNCVADLLKENSSEISFKPPQPLDLSANLVQEKKTDFCFKEHSILNFNNNNNVEEKKGDIEFDSDKENLKSKLKCIEVTITGPKEKENYQPCDLFLNDIARLVPKLIGKDCREIDILDRTCDRYVDVKKPRLYYIISEPTWQLFQSTKERIILTNDQSLGQQIQKKDSSEKPSFLVFDQYSLAKYLADYCKEIGGCFEYTCVEDTPNYLEVIGGRQNNSIKESKQCNVFDKITEMTDLVIASDIKVDKSGKKADLFRKDEELRRKDTFRCLDKNEKRPILTAAEKNMSDPDDKVDCGSPDVKHCFGDEEDEDEDEDCDINDAFSSQTVEGEDCDEDQDGDDCEEGGGDENEDYEEDECNREKDKPKCRRKCSHTKRGQKADSRNKKITRLKSGCKKPNAPKRAARKKCMASKKPKKCGGRAPKKTVCGSEARKSCRSQSKASTGRKSCASSYKAKSQRGRCGGNSGGSSGCGAKKRKLSAKSNKCAKKKKVSACQKPKKKPCDGGRRARSAKSARSSRCDKRARSAKSSRSARSSNCKKAAKKKKQDMCEVLDSPSSGGKKSEDKCSSKKSKIQGMKIVTKCGKRKVIRPEVCSELVRKRTRLEAKSKKGCKKKDDSKIKKKLKCLRKKICKKKEDLKKSRKGCKEKSSDGCDRAKKKSTPCKSTPKPKSAKKGCRR